jgi:hypothetical protein
MGVLVDFVALCGKTQAGEATRARFGGSKPAPGAIAHQAR